MIVHLATQRSGGAGAAACRLHEKLRRLGVDSRLLSADTTANEADGYHVVSRRPMPLSQRLARKWGGGLTVAEKWQATNQDAGVGAVYTAGIESDFPIQQHPLLKQASVINLHWTTGILPWRAFFETVRCPIVWTLHDMNAFSGIYHYEIDSFDAAPAAQQLDKSIGDLKQRLLLDQNIHVVTPSQWLKNASETTPSLGDKPHCCIPNGLNTDVYRPYAASVAREVMGLPASRRLLLTVAESLQNRRKGMDLLAGALRQRPLGESWDVVTVGRGDFGGVDYPVHALGTIQDDRLMALLYAACDATVVTSRQDNLPNVILESLCCGTPVIATPAGGIPEAIVVPRDGLLSKSIDANSVAHSLSELDCVQFNRHEIAQQAAERFDHSVQAERYCRLYESLAPGSAAASAALAP